MNDEQRKRYEEAALRHANYYSAKVHANFHELPYFQQEIFSHFIDGIRYCLETEADDLKKEIEHKSIRIALEREAVVTINNKCTQLTEQLHLAIEALEFYSNKYSWLLRDTESNVKDVISISDIGANLSNESTDYMTLSGGRKAREALQKIEAIKDKL